MRRTAGLEFFTEIDYYHKKMIIGYVGLAGISECGREVARVGMV